MDFGLSNRTALVLGAGGGLGTAIAQSLAAEGAKIALADISTEALDQTAKLLDETSAQYCSIEWDLSDLQGIDAHLKTIEQELGPVDILVNNTGGPPPGSVSGQDQVVWEEWFGAMVQPVIAITDAVLPGMKERGFGRIITSASSGVISPIPNLGLSNALRSTLLGWSKTLASEVGAYGVTSNIILPGRIATKRILFPDEKKAERESRSLEDVRAESHASIPVGRYGEPTEYGDTAAFLASERASYINGSVIRVDGGYVNSI